MKRAIIIMTKVPTAGNVKTRLQNVISPEKCAELAEAFLKDAVKKAKSISKKTFIAFFPSNELQNLKEILPDYQDFLEQKGENLGERIFNAFEFVFSRKFDEVVMIGIDSPTFPIDFIEQAFEFLETNSDVVLGSTEDGGFYLIGLRVLLKEIFENVAWSSPKTFEQVFANVQKLNLHLREVPGWYDVDEENDFNRLKEEFRHNSNAKRRAPHTFEWIKKRFLL